MSARDAGEPSKRLFQRIREAYYLDYPDLQKILDPEDVEKDVRLFGRIGHTIASQKRPNARLDYRHALLINSDDYIEKPANPKISSAQLKQVIAEFPKIQQEFFMKYYSRLENKGSEQSRAF